ncbi:MAG TPA: 30S ribosomal protein S16 [Micromonosporaceae bacterium]|nr:30S ribosomal protein S16 [Micromonosporaceae bacterium]
MAVKIRLLRMGKIRNPQYRIVVADSRTKRDGKVIEFIGVYQPKEHPSIIEVNSERAQHWLSVGAQPSEPVQRLLEKTGDWQKFKGLPAPEPLQAPAKRADRKALYEAESRSAAGLTPPAEAKPAKKAAKAAEPKAEAAEPKAETAEAPTAAAATEAPAGTAEAAKAEDAGPKAEPAAAAAETSEDADSAGTGAEG